MTGRHRSGRARHSARPAGPAQSVSRRQLLTAGAALPLIGGSAVPNDSPDWTTNIARPQLQYAGSPFAYTAAGLTQTLTLTPDVYTVGLAFEDNSTLEALTVTGDITGTTYLSLRPPLDSPGPVQWIPVMSAVDTSIDVDIIATGSGQMWVVTMGESAGVIAYPANGAMPVQIVGEPLAFTTDQVAATSNPWLHPRHCKYLDTGALAVGGSFTAIPAVAGASIYLFDMVMQTIDSGNFLQVWDGPANTGIHVDIFVSQLTGTPVNAYLPTAHPHHYSGVQLTAGNALTLENTGGATHDWVGYVTYTQI